MENLSYDIVIEDENMESLAVALKEHLSASHVPGIEYIDFKKVDSIKGQMGVGEILGSLSVVIKAANEPLTELAKSLRDFVQSFRTNVEIRKGDQVVKISSSHPQKIEELVKILMEKY